LFELKWKPYGNTASVKCIPGMPTIAVDNFVGKPLGSASGVRRYWRGFRMAGF
jgi:hypothetical protein